MPALADSPTLGRGSDWNSFYSTEPLAGSDPFSPSAFGLLLFSQPDAASALALLGGSPGTLGLTFADISGTLAVEQLPPGSVVTVDDIGQDALYFFNESTGLPSLASADEVGSFLSDHIGFSDLSGTISLSQFPPGSVAAVESIDEDAIYFFDNALFQPELINATDAKTFLDINFLDISGTIDLSQFPDGSVAELDSIDEDALYFFNNALFLPQLISAADTKTFLALSFSDIGGTLDLSQLPPGTAATIDPIDEDAIYFYNDSTQTPSLIGKDDALVFLLPDQTSHDGEFLQTNAGVLSWAAASGGSGDVATDSIWDAKGDLAVGTGSDTAAKLTAGSNDTILMADSGQTTGLKWGSPSTVRTALALVIGTNVQAWDADLDTWATKTPYAGTLTITTGKTFDVTNNLTLSGTDGSTLAIGGGGTLGTAAYTSATAYEVPLTFSTGLTRSTNTITVNTSQNIATLSNLTSNGFVKTSGGTGALSIDTSTYLTTASAASTYQPLDSDLTTLAGLTATTDNFIVSVSSAWASRTPSQVRTTLGLVIGTDVQAYDADLTTWAGITPGTGVGAALAVNVGSSGAFVTFGGALGTPSSGTLTNCTFPTLNQSTTGSAATLTTSRNLWGVGFNGSANIGGAIELGTAGTTDCTLDRSSAGIASVEGVEVPTISSTHTLTNKRITARVDDQNAPASPYAVNSDSYDMSVLRGISGALTINAPTGTPTQGQKLLIRFKDDGTARALTWQTGSSGYFRASSDLALPTTTTLSKTLYCGFVYNSTDSRWDLVAKLDNF